MDVIIRRNANANITPNITWRKKEGEEWVKMLGNKITRSSLSRQTVSVSQSVSQSVVFNRRKRSLSPMGLYSFHCQLIGTMFIFFWSGSSGFAYKLATLVKTDTFRVVVVVLSVGLVLLNYSWIPFGKSPFKSPLNPKESLFFFCIININLG